MKKREFIKAIILDSISSTFLLMSFWVMLFQPSEERLLQLDLNIILTLSIFLLSSAFCVTLYKKKVKTLGLSLFQTKKVGSLSISKPWYQTFVGYQLLILFTVAFIGGIQATGLSFYELFSPAGFSGAKNIFFSLFNPNFDILPQAVLKIVETIFMAFMATILALPLAFILSFLCAKNIMDKNPSTFAIYTILRIFLNITRSVEPLIWAIIFSVWVGIGPFAGMLALWLHSFVSLAKNFSELAEGIDSGPIEAIEATGANLTQVVWFAVVPQVILPYTAFSIFRWDINVRMATVIGLVGGGGIGTLINQYQGQALWKEVGCLVLVIALAVWAMDTLSAYLRDALK